MSDFAVLVIDDERPVRTLIRHILGQEGFTVLEAENGKEALRAFASAMPGLVITDIFMPEADGIETIRQIRESNPDVKVLAISGGGRYRIDLLDGIELLGADGALTKPFNRRELIEAVDRLRSDPPKLPRELLS
jgi:CheY-like chemotaxis protein